jgi:urease beta subunit
MIPGEYVLGQGDIEALEGRPTVELIVANTADRPIQVGSHFHFFEANRALRFDRRRAFGMRSTSRGTAVRFEPGDEKRVTSWPGRRAGGLRPERPHRGPTDRPGRRRALGARAGEGFSNEDDPGPIRRPLWPHHGDRVRLADTDLFDGGGARPHGARRGSQVRRREGAPRRHGPVGARDAAPMACSTSSSPTLSSWTTGAW